MTSNKIDLDINNYTKSDLISFFKLTNNYTNAELENNEQLMKKKILNSNHESKYKYEVLSFMLQAKEFLKIKEEENKIMVNEAEINPINNIGKIINPSSNHPSLQTQSIISNNITPYGNYIRKTNYVFDTRYRDDFFDSIPSVSTFTLPVTISNVVSITLASIQFANTAFTFNDDYKTNELYIFEETTNNEGIVVLPEGNYDVYNFPTQLEKAINEQIVGVYVPEGPNRFNVSISEFTGFTTISNSVYNFRMNIIKKNPYDINCSIFRKNVKYTPVDSKLGINQARLFQTMGYQIGYRKIEYIGSNSYTSESQFDSLFTDNIYFTMNEFNPGCTYSTVYGILPSSVIDDNILAVIPVTTPPFTVTWDTMANFIYKTRTYQGPININKLKFSLVSRVGRVINFHDNNFAFILEIDTIYNNVQFANNM
jgi:hypothetical protein